MIVLSDAGQVNRLAQVFKLDLPGQLGGAGPAILPRAVYDDMCSEQPYAEQLQYTFEIGDVKDPALVETLRSELDLGQAQAIALARERGAELLIVDDRRSRAVAARLGLPHVGLLALLLEGKRRGKLKALAPLLDDIDPYGHWVGEDVYRRALTEAGE